jgi:multicomponent Na+:H+ antiporter subunit C
MELVFALLVGGLYAAGLYMVMQRSLVRLIIGLALLSHAANVLIFVAAGVTPGRAPIVDPGATTIQGAADPLPQALILTAIVIGFAVLAFFLVLAQRAYAVAASEDLDALTTTDT